MAEPKRIGANQRLAIKSKVKNAGTSRRAPRKSLPVKPGWIALLLLSLILVVFLGGRLLPILEKIHLPRLPGIALPHVVMPKMSALRFAPSKPNNLSVGNILINGCSEVDTAVIKDLIPCTGDSFSVSPRELKGRIEAIDWVDKADVSIRDNSLKIQVVERIPFVFAVIQGDIRFLDKSGFLWDGASAHSFTIPVVTGVNDTVDKKGRKIVGAKELARLRTVMGRLNPLAIQLNQSLVQLDFLADSVLSIRFESMPTTILLKEKEMESRFPQIEEILNRSGVEYKGHAIKKINLCYGTIAFVEPMDNLNSRIEIHNEYKDSMKTEIALSDTNVSDSIHGGHRGR